MNKKKKNFPLSPLDAIVLIYKGICINICSFYSSSFHSWLKKSQIRTETMDSNFLLIWGSEIILDNLCKNVFFIILQAPPTLPQHHEVPHCAAHGGGVQGRAGTPKRDSATRIVGLFITLGVALGPNKGPPTGFTFSKELQFFNCAHTI